MIRKLDTDGDGLISRQKFFLGLMFEVRPRARTLHARTCTQAPPSALPLCVAAHRSVM